MNDLAFLDLKGGGFVVVDAHRFDELRKSVWYRRDDGYVFAGKGPHSLEDLHLARLVNRAPDGMWTDHIDGDLRNYTERNLRSVTPHQNHANTSKTKKWTYSTFKGVTWYNRHGKWMAQICVHGRNIFLGYFEEEINAALAYDSAAVYYFAGFAKLNFPGHKSAPYDVSREPRGSQRKKRPYVSKKIKDDTVFE